MGGVVAHPPLQEAAGESTTKVDHVGGCVEHALVEQLFDIRIQCHLRPYCGRCACCGMLSLARGAVRGRVPSSRRFIRRTVPRASMCDESLWADVTRVSQSARLAGAICGIDSVEETVRDGATEVEARAGDCCSLAVCSAHASHVCQLVVRVATALRDKAKAVLKEKTLAVTNPFLPYDEQLFVRCLVRATRACREPCAATVRPSAVCSQCSRPPVCLQPPSHVLLLNKFNVVDYHLLVVTAAFEQQTAPLSVGDIAATRFALGAYPFGGLAFFNCGEASGHSQPHKHVQLVPLPLSSRPGAAPVPIALLLQAAAAATPCGIVFSVTALPFRNYCVAWGRPVSDEQLASWQVTLRALALGDSPAASYNLLMADAWMMAIPRSAERGHGIAVNALAFAGTLLVRSTEELERVRSDPMAILLAAGVPW